MLAKTMLVAADETIQIVQAGSPSQETLTVYRGTNYLIIGQALTSLSNANAYGISSTDTWEAHIGVIEGANANAVVSITDANAWNQVSDYANVNTELGLFCFELNTAGSALTTDMANDVSKNYTMEIISYSNSAAPNLLCSSTITINNLAVGS